MTWDFIFIRIALSSEKKTCNEYVLCFDFVKYCNILNFLWKKLIKNMWRWLKAFFAEIQSNYSCQKSTRKFTLLEKSNRILLILWINMCKSYKMRFRKWPSKCNGFSLQKKNISKLLLFLNLKILNTFICECFL